jgi:NAD(P)-dependent dehydrogenase (short-subunit alcohol dehydrogenase family)
VSRPFEGKTALVTGAGRGIGRAIALDLAARGARLVLLARSTRELDATASTVHERGGVALSIPTDVGDLGALRRAVTSARHEFGDVDMLINNAARVSPLGPSVALDADDWAAAMAVNLIGPVALTLAVVPGMLVRGWGRVANVSSAVVGRPESMVGGNAYVTSKAALEAHTLNLAAELAGTGVTVNVYRPGTVDTQMQEWIRAQPAEEIGAALHERFVAMHDGGTLISPAESARSLVDRLMGGETGQVWNVNGD